MVDALRDTIPIRRTKKDDILRASSVKRYGKKKHRTIPKPRSADPDLVNESGHQHAIAYVEGDKSLWSKSNHKMYGNPKYSSLMSSACLRFGFWVGLLVKTLTALKLVGRSAPDLYGDNNTRLFTY
ncbi:hypothetical protein LguiB_032047 [Lonicera macranthoides]